MAQSCIANIYSSTQTYVVGDYCIYDQNLYRCTTAIVTPEEWTQGHWTATKVANEIKQVKQDKFSKTGITGNYSPSSTYAKGDYCIYNNLLYRCISEISTAENWNPSHWQSTTVMNEVGSGGATEITVTAFSVSPNKAEMGSTVSSVTVSFECNKVPNTLTIDGTAITRAKSGTQALSVSLTANKTFVLAATDSYRTDTKTATLTFMNRVIHGIGAIPQSLNSAFVNGLSSKTLQNTRGMTFSETATAGNYIWYCVPTRLGTCTFKVGGFEGGFEASQTVSVTNASGYTENYYVYRSTNSGLGSTSVTVS